MTGYQDTNIFGPDNDILRGEIATVPYRMAGGSSVDYVSNPFDDVESDMYYAVPVVWANQAGIVTGYLDGMNEFRPNNATTREEFYVMLYRYAQVTG